MMTSKLEIPDVKTRDGRLLAPALDAAAALRACGFEVGFKQEQQSEFRRRDIRETAPAAPVWCVFSDPETAAELLQRVSIGTGPQALQVRAPEHPLLCALYAIRSLRALCSWFADPAHPPAAAKPSAGGRLCFLTTAHVGAANLVPLQWQGPDADKTLAQLHNVTCRVENVDTVFCAAAAVCGFIPHPQLTGAQPTVSFADESLTFPGLRLGHTQLPEIPGTPEGQRHAFGIAATAAATWLILRRRIEEHRRRTWLIRGARRHTAIVSSELLRSGNGMSGEIMDEIADHLS